MPLLDHFHPPLSVRRHWQGFHSAWASEIARQLNAVLPPRYFAEPTVELGGQAQIDVATLEETAPGVSLEDSGRVAVWAPARPALSVPVDFAGLDVFEVRIVNDEEGPRLVAAIELVSPANKDRPTHRRAFVVKCGSYLQQGASVCMVDVVTSRAGNLYAELLQLLAVPAERPALSAAALFAAALRTVPASDGWRLEAWPEPIEVGTDLPTLPLWLAADLSLPLELERTYHATCAGLRLPG